MNSKLKIILVSILLFVILGGGVFAIIYFSSSRGKYKVIATIFPVYDICRNVMGSDDDILLLEDSGADMHNFQPSAKDIAVLSTADVFVYIGGESDDWVSGVLRSANNKNLKSLCLMNAIDALEESDEGIIENSEHEHEHEHEENDEHDEEDEEVEYDEHIWLSVKNMIEMTRSIVNTLSKAFPDKQEIYRINGDNYIAQLQELDDAYSEIANSSKTLVFADRFPFLYLTNDYNLKYIAAYSGCSAEVDSNPDTISRLIEKVNEEDLDYICVLETSSGQIDRAVVEGCNRNIQTLVINSCQQVSANKVNTLSYIEIMQSNLVNLKKALGYENN